MIDAPRRLILAPGGLEAQHDAALQVLAGSQELLLGRGVLHAARQLVGDDAQRLREVLRARPEIQADLTGARVHVGVGEDRVRQAPALADLLEEPGGGRSAEDPFEHAQREAPLVVAGDSCPADAHVVLLGLFLQEVGPRAELRCAVCFAPVRVTASGAAGAHARAIRTISS